MDKSTACQLALSLLGEHQVKPHTPQAVLLSQQYTECVRYANSLAHWSFARAKRTLSPLSSSVAADGVTTYAIPADCLRIISLTTTSGERVPKWKIFSNFIECSSAPSDTLTLIYTSDLLSAQADLPDAAPSFCQYVIHLLAARIAPSITGELALQTELENRAQTYLSQAMTFDAQQEASNDQSPLHNTLGLNSRRDNSYFRILTF
jgi:hypothetical protein